MVEKVGDRLYWENWAREIGLIAQKFIRCSIARVVKEGLHKEAFVEFLNGLQKNLNPSIDEGQAVEMLAQRSNPTEQEVYAGRLAEETNISKTAIMAQLADAVKKAGSKRRREQDRARLQEGEMNQIKVPYSAGRGGSWAWPAQSSGSLPPSPAGGRA